MAWEILNTGKVKIDPSTATDEALFNSHVMAGNMRCGKDCRHMLHAMSDKVGVDEKTRLQALSGFGIVGRYEAYIGAPKDFTKLPEYEKIERILRDSLLACLAVRDCGYDEGLLLGAYEADVKAVMANKPESFRVVSQKAKVLGDRVIDKCCEIWAGNCEAYAAMDDPSKGMHPLKTWHELFPGIEPYPASLDSWAPRN